MKRISVILVLIMCVFYLVGCGGNYVEKELVRNTIEKFYFSLYLLDPVKEIEPLLDVTFNNKEEFLFFLKTIHSSTDLNYCSVCFESIRISSGRAYVKTIFVYDYFVDDDNQQFVVNNEFTLIKRGSEWKITEFKCFL
ncbi:hypothetical protein BBF96_05315 [Anoxybacter fermentans]|uniref:DUF4829 domain-containing protein n=1 Tax=Anoxybacter fermentans TaxID=1323375 RepID=A0A3S9SX74_9FIRM|nr:hypothetical protein [Anoxybacter fermentans]AZR72858.1 hypothetical protein BBF96_05315 [Anoxybacter fermentans]